jgi:hypothetical protein
MLRECGFAHVGDMLVAMLAAIAHSDAALVPPLGASLAVPDPASIAVEMATAIGGMLAARARSSHVEADALHDVPRRQISPDPSSLATALHDAVDSFPILRTMKTRHAWFVPMLEVLLALPEAANSRRSSIARRLTTSVTPQATVDVPSFDSVVRPPSEPAASHRRRAHPTHGPLAGAKDHSWEAYTMAIVFVQRPL